MSFGLVKHNNNSISAITTAGNLTQGKMTLLQTQTASSSASISFTSNIDSTYPIYLFKFINIHQSQTSFASLDVGFRDGGSDYDAVKTTSKFEVYHTESGSHSFAYSGGDDLAQSTNFQRLGLPGYNNDESMVGQLFLFAPSDTTFVKHFMSRTNGYYTGSNASWSEFVAGYINTTTAIDGVQFKMSGGNIDSGTIKLYGIKGS